MSYEGCTLLAQSNFMALEQELSVREDFHEEWELIAVDHPKLGQVVRLSYRADDRTTLGLPRYLEAWFRQLAETYVADPDILLQLEAEAYRNQLAEDLDSMQADIGQLSKKDLDEIADALDPANIRYDIDGTPYHTERDLLITTSQVASIDIEDRRVVNPSRYAVYRDTDGHFLGGRVIGGDPLGERIQIEDERSGSVHRGKMVRDSWAFDGHRPRFELVSNVTPRVANLNPGPGAGGFVGWWAGYLGGSVLASIVGGGAVGNALAWSIASLGGAYGAYMIAPKDRKARSAVGAGVGGSLFPFIGLGAAMGGWIGGMEADS